MKKALIGTILFLFIFQYVGIFIALKTQQFQIRKEIKLRLKKGVPENELITFRFSEEELNQLYWKKKNEFRYKGNMYDIVYRNIDTDGKHVFQCINDEQETSLFKHLDQLVARNMNPTSNSKNPLHQSVKLFNPARLPEITNSVNRFEFVTEIHSETNLDYLTPFLKLYTPPPKSFVNICA